MLSVYSHEFIRQLHGSFAHSHRKRATVRCLCSETRSDDVTNEYANQSRDQLIYIEVNFAGVYYCFNMLTIIAAIFTSVLIIFVSRRAERRTPPPRWVQVVSMGRGGNRKEPGMLGAWCKYGMGETERNASIGPILT